MRLLERQAELAQMSAALELAGNGRGSVVLVRGDAGIGKTSLLRHFTAGVAEQADVRWGTCDDLLTPHPFGPVWELAAGDAELHAALRANDRPRVFGLVLELLAGAERPAVLVIEDAHWADEATLDLIKHAGRRIDGCRGLVVVTCRDVALTGSHPLVRVVGDLPNEVVVRLALAPLTGGAVVELARVFGQPGAGLLEQSGGNPLFLTELLRNPGVEVPSSVRDLTLSRLSRLGPAARSLVSLVSVVPGRMEHALVERCAGEALEVFDECESHGLIESSPAAVAFRHEVVRRAVEVSLSAGERTRLNRVVLDALIDTGADPTRIVHHARWARDTAAVVQYAPLAAADAASLDSHREAVEHFRLLDPHVDAMPPAERARLLVAWAREEQIVGEAAQATRCAARAVETWRDVGDAAALSRALVQLSHARWFDLDRAGAEAAAAEAVLVLQHLPEATRELARAQSECAGLSMMAYRVHEAIELADRAIVSAELTGDQATLAHALTSKGAALSTPDYRTGCDLMEAGLQLAQQHGFGYHTIRACLHLADVALLHCDLDRAERFIAAGSAVAVDRERESFRTDFEVMAAHHRLLSGRLDEATALVEAALALCSPYFLPALHRLLGTLQSMRGAPEAGATLELAREAAERTQEPEHLLLAAVARAEHAWLGPDAAALEPETRPMQQRAVVLGHPWLAGALSLWLWKAGCLGEAPPVCAPPYRLQIQGHWREAAQMWDELGLPYRRAVALADGDGEAKVAALGILDRLGALPLAARLRQELRQAGVHRVPSQPSASTMAAGGLTARQLEVLHLLRAGLSNNDIARQLFISARTVEHHVTAILMALSATTRVEAVAIAERRGLLARAPT